MGEDSLRIRPSFDLAGLSGTVVVSTGCLDDFVGFFVITTVLEFILTPVAVPLLLLPFAVPVKLLNPNMLPALGITVPIFLPLSLFITVCILLVEALGVV